MKAWEVLLVVANLAFAAVGFLTYAPQLLRTPLWLWVFTPDCPTGWLLFALAYVSRNRAFRFFAFVAGLKYSVWTLLTQALYFNHFSQFPLWSAAIILTHLLMLAEVFLLKPDFEPRAAALSWLFFTAADVSDYFLGTCPWLPSEAHIPTLSAAAVLLTIFSPLAPLVWQRINTCREGGHL